SRRLDCRAWRCLWRVRGFDDRAHRAAALDAEALAGPGDLIAAEAHQPDGGGHQVLQRNQPCVASQFRELEDAPNDNCRGRNSESHRPRQHADADGAETGGDSEDQSPERGVTEDRADADGTHAAHGTGPSKLALPDRTERFFLERERYQRVGQPPLPAIVACELSQVEVVG